MLTITSMISWLFLVKKKKKKKKEKKKRKLLTLHCALSFLHGSINHNSKQSWLRLAKVESFLFDQISLYSHWKSSRSAGAPGVVSCSNTNINLQTLSGGPGSTPQHTQLVLQDMNCFTNMQPMQVDHTFVSPSISLIVCA